MFLAQPIILPPGQDPNAGKEVDDSLVWAILLSNGLFIALVTIVVALRIYTKFTMAKQVFLDDYLMTASAILFLALASLDVAAIPLGFGRHAQNLPGNTQLEQMKSMEKVLYHNFFSMLLICLSICLAKLSIVATLLHIFNAKTLTCNVMRKGLLIVSLIVVLCCAAQFFFVIFQCTTVRLSWMVSEIGISGSCSNLETAVVATGAVNAVTDFLITCAPIPSFMKLQMPLKQRICLSALFLSGLIACVFGWIRVVSAQGLGSIENAIDASYEDVEYFNWSVAEAGLCIITGSIPALRPLLATILPRLFGQCNMDELVETVKDTVNRVATRSGSRSRSRAGSRREHLRRSSEGTISSFTGISREHTFKEIESPKTERAHDLSNKVPKVSAVMESVSSFAMRTCCSLMKVFRRTHVWEDEERGRSRLSVINELDEVSSPKENEKKELRRLGNWIPVGISASMADVQWWWARSKVNPWRLSRTVNPSPGVVIIMTEVMVTSAKMDVQQSSHGCLV
ncbi:hypothetical protein N0V93_008108 [Gnomoniopsis smithogilvyi]|uniref:Rhodopsin domain-containing protein n=1 Tax=Gnomoniopsis smithogilvyi TaxID=1191159 RepID=A0A9W8YL35_9PEZI|nr:hypothetical protein N0V93_008108 [Gnomoniopsis smithogilvyi]